MHSPVKMSSRLCFCGIGDSSGSEFTCRARWRLIVGEDFPELLLVVQVGIILILFLRPEVLFVEAYVLGKTFFVGLLAFLDG